MTTAINEHGLKALSTTADATTVANGIKIELMVTKPIQVIRWGGTVVTTITTNPLLARLNFRPTAGSASGEVVGLTTAGVDVAGGSVSLSTALGVAGRAWEHEIIQAAPSVTPAISAGGGLVVLPGQSVSLEAFGTAPAAGAIAYFIEYIEFPFPGELVATGTVAGGGRGTLIKI
jgi:hypothetical protein